MFECYREIKFTPKTAALISTMNEIIDEYMAAGYTMTARQLYYQLVARNVVPNTLQSYKRCASIMNDARIAGVMDWDAIEDRTREFYQRPRWSSGKEILQGSASSFHKDMWDNQDTRVFVIVEKEALFGVLQVPCYKYDVPLLAARGYPSVSVLREFAENEINPALRSGQEIQILHLGDHDPSGTDMSRDLTERLYMFCEGEDIESRFERIALNMTQIRAERPPPNPVKKTDSRWKKYCHKYNTKESWELDALDPKYLDNLVSGHIVSFIDTDRWESKVKEIKEVKDKISEIAKEFEF